MTQRAQTASCCSLSLSPAACDDPNSTLLQPKTRCSPRGGSLSPVSPQHPFREQHLFFWRGAPRGQRNASEGFHQER